MVTVLPGTLTLDDQASFRFSRGKRGPLVPALSVSTWQAAPGRHSQPQRLEVKQRLGVALGIVHWVVSVARAPELLPLLAYSRINCCAVGSRRLLTPRPSNRRGRRTSLSLPKRKHASR